MAGGDQPASRLMGRRQKKKKAGGKKKETGDKKKETVTATSTSPSIDTEKKAGGEDVGALAGMGGLSFEGALRREKEVATLEPETRATAIASAASAEEGWEAAGTACDELQRACDAHALLWSRVSKLTPKRDEWFAKWQACEGAGRGDASLENQIRSNVLTGAAATAKSRECHAKARSARATKKRLLQLNSELTELTRQILNLEERCPIDSKRTVDQRMREAALTGDPAKVMAALQPAGRAHWQAAMQQRRAELLSQECQKYQGQKGGRAPTSFSREQLEELVERGVRDGPGSLAVAERQAVSRSVATGREPGSGGGGGGGDGPI